MPVENWSEALSSAATVLGLAPLVKAPNLIFLKIIETADRDLAWLNPQNQNWRSGVSSSKNAHADGQNSSERSFSFFRVRSKETGIPPGALHVLKHPLRFTSGEQRVSRANILPARCGLFVIRNVSYQTQLPLGSRRGIGLNPCPSPVETTGPINL